MLLIIDTSAAESLLGFDQLTQLDGREYLLRFLWLPRESSWYLDIMDQDATPLAMGIHLVANWPILRRFKDPRLPPGSLFIGNLNNEEATDPLDILPGGSSPLFYLTSDDPLLAS